ncbi:MAG: hypothetical protein V3T72_00485 [Thermoanaerobaculia bacterium]
MADQIVRATSQSWGERLGGSVKGVLFGVLLIGLGGWLLFWNEGRAVKRAKDLTEGASEVISVSEEGPLSANEGELVHFIGEAVSAGVLRDLVFGVVTDQLKLERSVEMYQWREESRSEDLLPAVARHPALRRRRGGGLLDRQAHAAERWKVRRRLGRGGGAATTRGAASASASGLKKAPRGL